MMILCPTEFSIFCVCVIYRSFNYYVYIASEIDEYMSM
jgi:hypothetical protein